MTISVIVHILNEDPIVAEIEEMPNPTDTFLIVQNPRKRDGKDLHYLDSSVTTVAWPWSRIAFLEFLPTETEDQIIGFVRE
ncbi:MAG: hypothetical protein OEZ02_14840 [Anaerolineae bacterium]|nr:hypothetical protein [Anaerolineae bacterium]